jgi:hypothetical protein
MEPTLRDSDEILVDRTPRPLRAGIHVIRVDDVLLVKRLEAGAAGMIRVISDNPAYPRMERRWMKWTWSAAWCGRAARSEPAARRLAICRCAGHFRGMSQTRQHPAAHASGDPARHPLQQNCTLLWCTATMKAAVIDPGGDLDRIKALVAKAGVTVEKLLITHGHLDHCGGAAQLARELGVPIEGPHEADLFWIAKLAEDRAAGACRRKSSRPAAGWSRAIR